MASGKHFELIKELSGFTCSAYAKLIKHLRQRLKVLTFSELSSEDESFLVIRHDIDASVRDALKMARLEQGLGIRSTYFVLFSNRFYNVLERENLSMLRQISEQGHEIGLHYDLETYERYSRNLNDILDTEVDLLSSLLDRRVVSIARHNPSLTSLEDPFANTTRYVNAYDRRRCELYVSDSCRAWQVQDLSYMLSFDCKRVQLLIHPFLWREDVCDRYTLLERFFEESENDNRNYKSKWQEIWRKNPKVAEFDNVTVMLRS